MGFWILRETLHEVLRGGTGTLRLPDLAEGLRRLGITLGETDLNKARLP